MSFYLIVFAIIIAFISGIPGLFLGQRSTLSQRISCIVMCTSGLSGIFGAGAVLLSDFNPYFRLWPVISNQFVTIDSLSAFFLVPIFLMGGLGALFGIGYWPQNRHPSNSKKLQLFWGFIIAGMAILVISKHSMLFLFGWEIMALSAFFLVSTEDNRSESRHAALVYLIATHISTLALFALFSLWKSTSGSYLLIPLINTPGIAVKNVLFFLAIIGFGLKAGVMPFHFWLPSAHATAPSHVSALLSGVVLKMGIYGLVRWVTLFPDPPVAWGSIILALGCISGLLGVIFAIAQHDLKRLLAYHSVENIGIILMGLGVAMLGKSIKEPLLVSLGMAGCLLHVWNHSLFKSLLFLCAGAVVHTTHTRQMDKLGGLSKTMPWTAVFFVIGAVAISGLPPLNGFISELFVYLGLFRIITSVQNGFEAAIGVAVLSMIGALAGACFVKVYGTVFLGNKRTKTHKTHDATISMKTPMVILGLLCFLIGVIPSLFTSGIKNAVSVWIADSSLSVLNVSTIAPLQTISIISVITIMVVTGIGLAVANMRKNVACTGTWDCGYVSPTEKMQYTSSSFADSITVWFSWILRPREHKPQISELFPPQKHMSSHIDEPVLDRVLLPLMTWYKQCSGWFHRFQHGLIQHYILYIFIILFLLLCIEMPVKDVITGWFIH